MARRDGAGDLLVTCVMCVVLIAVIVLTFWWLRGWGPVFGALQ